MRKARAQGPAGYYVTQANLYAHGLIAAGVPVEWVAICYWPRSGRLADLYVWLQRYDQAWPTPAWTRLATLRSSSPPAGTSGARSSRSPSTTATRASSTARGDRPGRGLRRRPVTEVYPGPAR
jgi:hypothetical protein